MTMNAPIYLDAFRAHTGAVSAAARQEIGAPVPSCPGWTIANVVGHLGALYTSLARNIRFGNGQDIVHGLADLDLEPAYVTWFQRGRTADTAPPDVADWFDRTAFRLSEILADSDPATPTWSWFPPDQTVGFWLRRMAHETAIHAWDARTALGASYDFQSDLAADGTDEVLTVYAPATCRPKSDVEGHGETYHVHRTDGGGEWFILFEGSDMVVTREHRKADVALRGSASDLFLAFWHRLPLEELDIRGDEALVTRYFELAPPD